MNLVGRSWTKRSSGSRLTTRTCADVDLDPYPQIQHSATARDEDVDEDWSRRERDPLAACPTVGAKCHGGLHGISIRDGKDCGARRRWRSGGIGHKHGKNTRDVPRFGALLVEVTPLRPACLMYMME